MNRVQTSATSSQGRRGSHGSTDSPNPTSGITEEVARRIADYAPADVPPETWESIRPFVISVLRQAEPTGRSAFEQFARVSTLVSRWCHEQGIVLDIEVVFDPDTIERFFSEGLKDLPSRGSYRTVLRRLGRTLTKTAPWQPRPEPMTRRKAALPYTLRELDILEQDAQRQSTDLRRRAALVLIALAAGAGLDGRWARSIRGSDVHISSGIVLVRAGDPRPRTVPVLDRYEDLLPPLAEQAGDGLLLGGTSTHRNRITKLVAGFEHGPSHPDLSVPRLRSSWIVEHLRRGTRLPELLAAAGTSRIETFDELLAWVEPMQEADALRMLRGTA